MYHKVRSQLKIDLTEVEITECLKAAKAVGGLWTAVDFIPSKNREKEPPYILEVNSSLVQRVLKKQVVKIYQKKL